MFLADSLWQPSSFYWFNWQDWARASLEGSFMLQNVRIFDSLNFVVWLACERDYPYICRQHAQICQLGQTRTRYCMPLRCISRIGERQQPTYICIQLSWKKKWLWEATRKLHLLFKKGWMEYLLLSIVCTLFIPCMPGLILRWLGVIYRVLLIRLRELEQRSTKVTITFAIYFITDGSYINECLPNLTLILHVSSTPLYQSDLLLLGMLFIPSTIFLYNGSLFHGNFLLLV